ncbi:MAG: MarP family serine protease [Pseudonocardiaceae bacterium]
MNWVDVLVLMLALFAGISGARQGMLTAAASFIGVLAGAVIGVRIAPDLVDQVQNPAVRVAFGVTIVILLVALGETLGVWLGRVIPGRFDNNDGLRQVDSVLGAVVQGIAALVVAWLVAVPLSSSAYLGLTVGVRESRVLGVVNTFMPDTLRQLPTELARLLDVSGFPDLLSPFFRTPVTNVDPVDPALRDSPVVRRAESSVLKIRGRASSCSRALEGTAFVVAPERMLTNAHVVAGTDEVSVETLDGNMLVARVVSYDPATDAAVLAVPGLEAPVLSLAAQPATSGQNALVLGYPLDGPYTPEAARVREQIRLRGPNIYSTRTVVRDVYTVRAVVRSGNSGGPLLDESGQVLGMVFGAAVDDEETGFALTNEEITDDISAASDLTEEVDTGTCAI